MRIYLAARYSRAEGMRSVAKGLRQRGHVVTSSWIGGGHQTSGAETKDRAEWAAEDMADLLSADVLITYTEAEIPYPGRGGRHVEFGIALGLGKRCIVVGPRENVFHCLPQVEVYATFDQMMTGLRYGPPSPLHPGESRDRGTVGGVG